MQMKLDHMKKFIVVGDRVLIRPATDAGKTDSGLYLPPGVSEKEKIQSGYIIKAGERRDRGQRVRAGLEPSRSGCGRGGPQLVRLPAARLALQPVPRLAGRRS